MPKRKFAFTWRIGALVGGVILIGSTGMLLSFLADANAQNTKSPAAAPTSGGEKKPGMLGGMLDRWRGKGQSEGGGATGSPNPSGSDGWKPEGFKILKPNQRVTLNTCQANPFACICPAGTMRIEMREVDVEGRGHVSKMMCLSMQCPTGKIIRQVIGLTGEVSYRCASPGQWN